MRISDWSSDVCSSDLYDWADLSPRHPEKLTAFKAKGGKVIYWHGIADPGIPVSEIITHYKDLQQSVPASSDFARLFLAPGTYHCGGGTGPQDVPARALEKVIDRKSNRLNSSP